MGVTSFFVVGAIQIYAFLFQKLEIRLPDFLSGQSGRTGYDGIDPYMNDILIVSIFFTNERSGNSRDIMVQTIKRMG